MSSAPHLPHPHNEPNHDKTTDERNPMKFLKHGLMAIGTELFFNILIGTPLFNYQTETQISVENELVYDTSMIVHDRYRGWRTDILIRLLRVGGGEILNKINGNAIFQTFITSSILFPIQRYRIQQVDVISTEEKKIEVTPNLLTDITRNGFVEFILYSTCSVAVSNFFGPYVTKAIVNNKIFLDEEAVKRASNALSYALSSLILSPIEVIYKRKIAGGRHSSSVAQACIKSSLLTVSISSLGLLQYWAYRTINRSLR
ncbi:hypothetical protein AKO1_011706 [Acrasis kona]|uniref:Uncharacterized protein n=1 Tax=Acrasis kona TaxID=1008807 RepID=A0AAW2Z7J3_9EUKA